jgi:phage tail sheath gpL-like
MTISTAVDLSAVARVVGVKTAFKDLRGGNVLFLPQRIAVVGQGSTASVYPTTKIQLTSERAVAERFGYGSPLHLAARQLLPVNGDGVGSIPVTFYPLVDDGSGVAAAGEIAPSGTQTELATYIVRINNVDSAAFTVAAGATVAARCTSMVAAINATLHIPVVATATATEVDIVAKWKGASGNDIKIEVIGSTTAGTTFAITQPTGGAVNPNVDSALAQFGNVWESMVLNCLNVEDTVTLGKINTVGEGRWGALVRKPFVSFVGNVASSVNSAITVSDARRTDRINAQLVSPGSKDLPLVVAARQLARIAPVANNNPARDYGSLDASGLTPGADSVQWDYPSRDQAVKGGSSTVEVKDSVVNISDVVTFFHPTGDALPAYRYVCDIVKMQSIIFNLDLIFATAEWDGAPLIPDDQPTVNPTARKPKTAVTAVNSMIDSLGLNAIISDPATAKTRTMAAISAQNPKRLDVALTVQLAGNANIISVDFNFGFYFGVTPVVGV